MAGKKCPDLELTVLDVENGRENTTLHSFRGDRIGVFDLWSSSCTRCPLALEKLNDFAKGKQGPLFASINCDDADLAEELVDEQEWSNMTHLYMTVEQKNICKQELGLKEFPFVIVVQADGVVAYAGAPKNVDLDELLAELENGRDAQDENDPPNLAGGDVDVKGAGLSSRLEDFSLTEDF